MALTPRTGPPEDNPKGSTTCAHLRGGPLSPKGLSLPSESPFAMEGQAWACGPATAPLCLAHPCHGLHVNSPSRLPAAGHLAPSTSDHRQACFLLRRAGTSTPGQTGDKPFLPPRTLEGPFSMQACLRAGQLPPPLSPPCTPCTAHHSDTCGRRHQAHCHLQPLAPTC